MDADQEHWREWCRQAAAKIVPERLFGLVKEINRILLEREARVLREWHC